MAADWLAKAVAGKGNIVELHGTPGSAPANERRKAFADGKTQFTDTDAKGALGREGHPRTLAKVHSFIHTLIRTLAMPQFRGQAKHSRRCS